MKDMEIAKNLKRDIENNQNHLKTAIRNHQYFLATLKDDPDNVDVQKEFNKAEEEIILIGLEQKTLLERLRTEYKSHQKNLKTNIIKNGIEDRRFNLTSALSRARKQNIVLRPSPPSTSISENSNEPLSTHSSPERIGSTPLVPHDLPQSEYMHYFGLVSHEVYREMQNKRVERKRRSTANPHFLYGSKGWDFLSKRKRNAYLMSAFSPPNTRQSVKKRNERVVSPPVVASTQNDSFVSAKSAFPSIPNLPSGLTIERVSPSSSPDSQTCVTCKQPGFLSTCELCKYGFHVDCHNRPLIQSPKLCPICMNKEEHNVGSISLPNRISISCVSTEVITEKIDLKQKLQEENKVLTAELTQLQDRHSQLTVSLRNQEVIRNDLLTTQISTDEKIKKILTFIETIKSPIKEVV